MDGVLDYVVLHHDEAVVTDLLLETRDTLLLRRRGELARKQAARLDRFGEAFDLLEFMVMLATELHEVDGVSGLVEQREGKEISIVRWMLLELGVQAASDILTLLRAGSAPGAMTRWRALHEVTVRAEFFETSGDAKNELAVRYLMHESFRAKQREVNWEAWIKHTGVRSSKVSNNLDPTRQALQQRFGNHFFSDAGWAAEHLPAISPRYAKKLAKNPDLRGPTLADLSNAIDRDKEQATWWQSLTDDANASTHASPDVLVEKWRQDAGELGADELGAETTFAGQAAAQRLHRLAWSCLAPNNAFLDMYDELSEVGQVERILGLPVVTELRDGATAAFLEANTV